MARAAPAAAAEPRARAESAGVSDADGHVVFAAAARRPLRHRLAQPRLHAAAPAPGAVASGGRFARWFERRDARRADANLSVSRGLAAFLESRFGVQHARVLYDRPASAFVPIERAERERFRQALFTRLGVHAGVVGFIVCPTSWTEDEDFDLVIDAVPRLEERIRGWEAASPGAPVSGAGDPGHRRRRAPRRVRAAFRRPARAPRSSCARGGSSRRTTRASSAARISGCACIGPRRVSTFR